MLIIPQVEAIRERDPELYEVLKRLTGGVNSLGRQLAVDPAAAGEPPEKIDLLEVSAADGIFDIRITDNTEKRRGINYFVEYDTAADFAGARVLDLGAGRNLRVSLGNQTLYFRAYSQYIGSEPSEPVAFGAPTAVAGGGTAAGPAPLPSSGSGTSTGGGGGFGGTDDGTTKLAET